MAAFDVEDKKAIISPGMYMLFIEFLHKFNVSHAEYVALPCIVNAIMLKVELDLILIVVFA